ncbi:MAG: anion permease [Akkermansiaceae bacterium]|nr:anion permease [Akkermansiaceae bacterium]
MSHEIIIIFVLLLAIVVLFAAERLPVDVITLLALCVLTGTRILTPAEAFAGFSNEVIIMLGAIFVLGGALQHTGVLHFGAALLLRLAGSNARRLTAYLMAASASVSGFMNNTTVAAVFVPPVSSLAQCSGISASKLLMPLAFASIIGGTCTLIGTSTNIAVSGYIARAGLEPLGMFEILPVGLVLLVAGIAFMVTLGNRMLPTHANDAVNDAAELRNYFTEVSVLPSSPLVGERAFDWELSLVGFRLVQIIRGGESLAIDPHTVIRAGDGLIIEGDAERLRQVSKIEGLVFKSKVDPEEIESDYPGADLLVVEAIVLPGGELTGATLKEVQFRQRYGASVLAVNRGGQPILESLATERLRQADVLLLHGPAERIEELRRPGAHLRLLGDDAAPMSPATDSRRGWAVLAIFAVAVACGGCGLLPMSVAFLCGAVLVILSGCIPAEKAREFIDWRLLILVGGMTAFGTAMEKTGAAELLASWVTGALSPYGVSAVLAGFLLLTIVLTQPMSNAAAALVVLPVAMASAAELGADPRTFAIGVMLAASISFIAPLEPACLLVYGAGKYRTLDFIKIGGLLTLLLVVIVLLMLPLLWPLYP